MEAGPLGPVEIVWDGRDASGRVVPDGRYFVMGERARSERLLLNVLPGAIAERLKRSSGVIADAYESCTVMFAVKPVPELKLIGVVPE